MSEPIVASRRRSGPSIGLLLLLFAGSGCSALIYELVWFHLLRLVIGASAISLAALLVSFMGGLGLGGVALPALISPKRHPLRVYAGLELGIAAFGIVLPLLLPYVQLGYLTFTGYGFTGILVRAIVCTLCLLPPTILMGGTLPAIARWTTTTPLGVSRLGFCYGANIAGAVLGALATSFFILRLYDTLVATAVAVMINLAVAAVALYLAARHSHGSVETLESSAGRAPRRPVAYAAIGLSGLTALGAEVVWTRQLSLLFGATVYTFSLVLAVFLAGLGLGGFAGARMARRLQRPGFALGWCQWLLVLALPYSAVMITEQIPFWRATETFMPWALESLPLGYVYDTFRCALAILPATMLWGASFPLALATAAEGRGESGRVVGTISAANTVGALVGTVFVSLLAIPYLGAHGAQQALIALAAVAAGGILWDELRRGSPAVLDSGRISPEQNPPRLLVPALCVLLMGNAAMAAQLVRPTPGALIAFGREIDSWDSITQLLYVAEGVNASVAVTEATAGVNQIHISGKVVASTHDFDMRIERMLGHIPAVIHPYPRSVLVVGFGAGVTAGSFVVHPEVERIVICEIEPRVLEAAREHFAEASHHVLDDPRTEIIYDDARHYLATTDAQFDIITSDPIHPWVRGAATLYSSEYLELVKQHLRPGGLVTQWVPMYETDEAAVKSQIATFVQAFPDATLWSSDFLEWGYDLVLFGQIDPAPIDAGAIDARLARDRAVHRSMDEVALGSSVDLLWTYAGRGRDLEPWLRGAEINRERSLRLQYLAGLALNQKQAYDIYHELLGYRAYPYDLFVTSRAVEAELRQGY